MHHHATLLFYLYLVIDGITCIARSSSSSSSSVSISYVAAFSPALRLINHNNNHCTYTVRRGIQHWQLRQYNYDHEDENENENKNDQDNINIKNELAWRTSKVRLEEEERNVSQGC